MRVYKHSGGDGKKEMNERNERKKERKKVKKEM
jgi:hypothetical protein